MKGDGSYRRTKNSLRNSFVAVGFQVISLLIGFWSRRIFLNHLGTEVMGLNTTAVSLLGFLNLAELGIGSAIAVTLYKPIFEGNRQEIKEIVALQGWLYKIIACIVIAGSIVLAFFFPAIFSKSELPLWYAYASFGVLLYSSLLGYFVNYKQILLDAHQLNYKIQLSTKTVAILKLVAQAFTVKYCDNGYLWWLGLETAAATITAIILSRTVNRTFPFIKGKVENPSALRHKYPEIATKVKQLFVHKMSGFVTFQSMPLLIYAFASLTTVAKYGNYQLLTNNLTVIFDAMLAGLAASVGNMVAEGNKEFTLRVFRELFSFRYWITATCCICLWFLTEPFISVWLGSEYILGKSTLSLIIALFYISGTRSTIDTFISAYGLFRDVWAPIVQALLTVGLSILLGRIWGLDGVLSGFVISQILMIKIWKPVFLFTTALHEPFSRYVWLLFKHLTVCAGAFVSIFFLAPCIPVNPTVSFLNFFVYASAVFVASAIITFFGIYIVEIGMRQFCRRLKVVNSFFAH